MKNSSLERAVASSSINTLTSKKMLTRVQVLSDTQMAIDNPLSRKEVRYSRTSGDEHDIAWMMIRSEAALLMANDPLANYM